MVRQSHIKAAFGSKGASGSHALKRRCWLMGGVVVMIFVLMNGRGGGGGGGNGNDVNKSSVEQHNSLRSSHPSAESATGSTTTSEHDMMGNYDDGSTHPDYEQPQQEPPPSDYDEIQEVVTHAVADIEDAEDEELEKSETMLSTSLKSAGNMLRIGMGKLVGSTMDDNELEAVAEEVESQLETEYTEQLQSLADGIRDQEVDMIDNMVNEEEGAGYSTERIETDIQRGEADAIAAVREGIDEAASEIQTSMQKRALEIEKQILEQRLSILLQKKVTLIIEDDHLEATEELLQGLQILGSSRTKPASSDYSSYSSGSTLSYTDSSREVNSLSTTSYNAHDSYGEGEMESSFSGQYSGGNEEEEEYDEENASNLEDWQT